MLKDYYEILGVSQKASDDQIRDAYKKLAKAYHPDKHQGDDFFAEKFKSLQEAYAVLSDPESRKDYDTDLAAELKGQKKTEEPKKQAKKKTTQKNSNSTSSKARTVKDLPSLIDIYFEQKIATVKTRKEYDTFLASPKKQYSSWVKIVLVVLVIILSTILLNPSFGLLKGLLP